MPSHRLILLLKCVQLADIEQFIARGGFRLDGVRSLAGSTGAVVMALVVVVFVDIEQSFQDVAAAVAYSVRSRTLTPARNAFASLSASVRAR